MSGVNPDKRSLHDHETCSPFVQDESLTPRDFMRGTRTASKAVRRIRGEIACAECRRLKIRCDKTVPCSTCVKRGCSALCPNSTIPPGDGSRFVLAATDHLRQKRARLDARMRSLEDAIAIIYATTSDRPHPLLTPVDDEDDDEPILKPVIEDTVPSFLVDSLGSLHIDSHGGTRFFGPSGGSESLLLKAKELEEETLFKTRGPLMEDLDPSYLPPAINKCFQSFPFLPPGVLPSVVLPMIEAFLPPMDRAIALCDIFLEHLSWMFNIVSRQQMLKELIPVIYKRGQMSYGAHDLALMLAILGIGSLMDLNLQPYNLEAQHYYRLARASLALESCLETQSVVTVKVLHLMSIYNGMSGKESNLEQSYIFLDLAGQVAIRIGFHTDPSLWGLQGKEAYERRGYFWNLLSAICWQSLVTGRPPTLLTACIDCRIPTSDEENLYQQDEAPLGFGIWGFQASVEYLIPVVKAVLAVNPPSYKAVLELDKTIRNSTLPTCSNSYDNRTASSMQTFVRSHYQDLILMFLHRGFFAHGMTEHPLDPFNSPFGPSVLAAYSSACVVLDDTKIQYYKQPLLCTRVWQIWSFAFSAAVIVGTVAIRGTHLNLNPPAFEEFQSACNMFQGAAETSSRAATAMPVLQVMLHKASQARQSFSQRHEPLLTEVQPDDELSFFAGRAKLVKNFEITRPSQLPPEVTAPSSVQSKTWHHYGSSSASVDPTGPIPESCLDNTQAICAGLTGGWNGLFHEIPYQWSAGKTVDSDRRPTHPYSGEAMVDDRWSSFINYSLIV